jgi:transketolase N-terminal domain/subunit
MTIKLVRYTVEGAGQFPFDMLRYDGSYPHQQTDSSAMEYDQLFTALKDSRRQVTLEKLCDVRVWEPCRERWVSFGWKVTNVENLL